VLNIIARKPRGEPGDDNEYVVIDRGPNPAAKNPDVDNTTGRYVSATANARSLASGEWFWGHYFDTRKEALAHFNGRATAPGVSPLVGIVR
jgi:hypothetical protein